MKATDLIVAPGNRLIRTDAQHERLLDATRTALAHADVAAVRLGASALAGNRFWSLLHDSGMTPRLLRPDEEAELPAYGLGSTDLVRTGPEWTRPSSYAVAELVAKVERWQPEWLAFTSKTVAALVARAEGRRPPGLGPHDWYVGGAQVFVLPGTSGANQRAFPKSPTNGFARASSASRSSIGPAVRAAARRRM